MTDAQIDIRMKFLTTFLDLPCIDRQISSLRCVKIYKIKKLFSIYSLETFYYIQRASSANKSINDDKEHAALEVKLVKSRTMIKNFVATSVVSVCKSQRALRTSLLQITLFYCTCTIVHYIYLYIYFG